MPQGVTFVRVRDEFGNEFSQSTQTSIPPGCQVIEGKPGATNSGDALPWKPKVNLPSADVEALKGAALDEALTAAGLPTTGKADEKRQRLADFEATQAPGQMAANEEETSA